MEYESFTTLKETTETKTQVKGSVFYCHSYPVQNPDEAHSILENLKGKYYDATHHCYAYKLQNNLFKYSDDGEPSGTAGIRILNAIEHFNLTNAAVIVIRYFGGTKLGVGLLGKTYYESALQGLNQVEKISKFEYQKIYIKVDFEFVSFVHRILSSINAKIDSTNYKNEVEFECFIKPAYIKSTIEKLIDLTHGKAIIKIDNKHIYL